MAWGVTYTPCLPTHTSTTGCCLIIDDCVLTDPSQAGRHSSRRPDQDRTAAGPLHSRRARSVCRWAARPRPRAAVEWLGCLQRAAALQPLRADDAGEGSGHAWSGVLQLPGARRCAGLSCAWAAAAGTAVKHLACTQRQGSSRNVGKLQPQQLSKVPHPA